MKDNLDGTRRRVDSAKVGPFVQIAAMAGERKVFEVVTATMLSGDNVFDLVWYLGVRLR